MNIERHLILQMRCCRRRANGRRPREGGWSPGWAKASAIGCRRTGARTKDGDGFVASGSPDMVVRASQLGNLRLEYYADPDTAPQRSADGGRRQQAGTGRPSSERADYFFHRHRTAGPEIFAARSSGAAGKSAVARGVVSILVAGGGRSAGLGRSRRKAGTNCARASANWSRRCRMPNWPGNLWRGWPECWIAASGISAGCFARNSAFRCGRGRPNCACNGPARCLPIPATRSATSLLKAAIATSACSTPCSKNVSASRPASGAGSACGNGNMSRVTPRQFKAPRNPQIFKPNYHYDHHDPSHARRQRGGLRHRKRDDRRQNHRRRAAAAVAVQLDDHHHQVPPVDHCAEGDEEIHGRLQLHARPAGHQEARRGI